MTSSGTSHSLLEAVKAKDEIAWERFVRLYRPLVAAWLCDAGLQPADVDDLAQLVFVRVNSKILSFQTGQGRFRGWLYTVTRNLLVDLQRRRQPSRSPGGSDNQRQLAELPHQEVPSSRTDEATREILKRALGEVKPLFQPNTWQAFWRTAIDGRNATEIANELQMTAANVRKAKSRVLRALRETLGDLSPTDDEQSSWNTD